jgi:2-aminobenzoate-CoA ligase
VPGFNGDDAMKFALQDHVKREVAPYKYPRAIEFVTRLPQNWDRKIEAFCAETDSASKHCASNAHNEINEFLRSF